MYNTLEIKDEQDALLIHTSLELFLESLKVTRITLRSLISNNGEDGYPAYNEETLNSVKEELKNAIMAINKVEALLDNVQGILNKGVVNIAPKINR